MNTEELLAKYDAVLKRESKAVQTRDCYLGYARRYAKFRAPEGTENTADAKVTAFLATFVDHSSTTRLQALNAMVSLYRALDHPLGKLPDWVRPRRKKGAKTWVTKSEAEAIIVHLREPWSEVAGMLFGSGLRIGECLELRIRDIDFERHTVTIRGGKGDKDRITVLARAMVPILKQRIEASRAIWEQDRSRKRPGVALPKTVRRKYPKAGEEWGMFWLWPAPGESRDRESGIVRRHHRHEDGFAKALRPAVQLSKVGKRVTAHTFRHGFCTAYVAAGGIITELQELMGHVSLETTMDYIHIVPELASRVGSPLDEPAPVVIPFKPALPSQARKQA